MNKDLKKIAKITLEILTKNSWKDVSLKDVKKKSKIISFEKLINEKKDLLKNLNAYFDYLLSLKIKNLDLSNEKDVIFEILMMRFDILQQNRKAILSISNSYKINPEDLIILIPAILDSIILIFKHAKISTKGLNSKIKIKGYFLIYILAFNSWTKDKSNSLEKTMVSLDNYLNQFEKLIKFFK
jgi:hypothetical protein